MSDVEMMNEDFSQLAKSHRPTTAAVQCEQVKPGKRASQGVNGRNTYKRLGSSILQQA